MVTRARLDAELVRRGLARSREQAAELIEQGRVAVRGVPPARPPPSSTATPRSSCTRRRRARVGLPRRAQADRRARRVRRSTSPGPRCLDAGASTGGFTDVLLDAGRGAGRRRRRRLRAARLAAAQRRAGAGARPHQRARADTRTRSAARPTSSSPTCRSSRCARCCPRSPRARPTAVTCCRWSSRSSRSASERLGAGGVVRDPALRLARARARSSAAARELGLRLRGAVASPLPGPSGNVEYFLWLRRGDGRATPATCDARRHGRRGRVRRDARRCWLVLHAGQRRPTCARAAAVAHPAAPSRRPAAGASRRSGPRSSTRDLPRLAPAAVVDGPARVRRGRRGRARARRRRHAAARRRAGPARPGCRCSGSTSARSGSSPRPRRSRSTRRFDAVVGGNYAVEERMTIDAVARRNGDVLARTWALNEASVEKSSAGADPRGGARGRRAAGVGASAATACCAPRPPAPRPTRSPRAGRWCGRRWRRCCWCRATRTPCSPGRW